METSLSKQSYLSNFITDEDSIRDQGNEKDIITHKISFLVVIIFSIGGLEYF